MRSAKREEMDRRLERGIILDGGLATELERLGLELDDPLWSARVLIDEPDAIQAVHLDYLTAGADCITTASYQASVLGLEEAGLSRRQVKDLLRLSVRLAQESRDFLLHAQEDSPSPVERPWVAASCGPYGAYLADGSEFRGDYDLTELQLYDFHAPRFEILAQAEPDLFAFETIPQAREAAAIARLLKLSPIPAWVSFTLADADHLASGEPFEAGLDPLADIESVLALGVNCVSPEWIAPAIDRIRARTDKKIIVYPNAGGTWNQDRQAWEGSEEIKPFVRLARSWWEGGARIVGGCCRTTPDHIKRLARQLRGTEPGGEARSG
jgi:homocysteine S-methyltransferase